MNTFGQRVADKTTKFMGSWTFIIMQVALLVLWLFLNIAHIFYHWDPYPFILMNLMLSMEAALTAPIIMIAQETQTRKTGKLDTLTHAEILRANDALERLEHKVDGIVQAQEKLRKKRSATVRRIR